MITNFPHVCRDSKNERKWRECPSYSSLRNECYFNSSNTVIWYTYVIQLRSRSLDVVYDEISFNVEDIGKACFQVYNPLWQKYLLFLAHIFTYIYIHTYRFL